MALATSISQAKNGVLMMKVIGPQLDSRLISLSPHPHARLVELARGPHVFHTPPYE